MCSRRANARLVGRRPPAAHPDRAFTLVEVLVATGIAGLVLIGVLSVHLHLLRSGIRIANYAEMESQVRRALEPFAHDVRMATAIKWNSATDVTLTVPTLAGSTAQMTYAFTPTGDALFVVPGADSSVTTGRNYLVRGLTPPTTGPAGFARFDRDGNAATSDAATKRIQLTLRLERRSTSMATATQSPVSATFTMRNKPPP